MKPDTIIAEARSWEKTPFRHQGRTKGVGVDCLGLVYEVAKSLGLTSTPWRPYGKEPAAGELEQALRGCDDLIEVSDPAPGDILVFRFAKDLQHVGFYTGRNIIHAYSPMRKCIEHRYCDKWKRRQVLAFRFVATQ